MERRFMVTGPAQLSLSNISGSVDIQPGDEGVIVVVAEKDPHSGDMERTRIEMEQLADGSVSVKTDVGESFWRWFGQHLCDVDYTVRVPRDCSVRLKSVSSRASVKGLNGRFEINSVSGDLNVEDLHGALRLNAVSGAVQGERLSGPADIETVSGDMTLTACQFESLKMNTVSGQLRVETPLGNGPYRFHSISGDVQLAVPADTRCTVQATSLSGRVHAELPVTRSEKSGQQWRVDVQGGGMELRIDSVSGGMSLVQSDAYPGALTQRQVGAPVPATADAASTKGINAPATPATESTPISEAAIETAEQTRRDILDRVARGELSVDEAIKVLRG
jgi:hypothetical protein